MLYAITYKGSSPSKAITSTLCVLSSHKIFSHVCAQKGERWGCAALKCSYSFYGAINFIFLWYIDSELLWQCISIKKRRWTKKCQLAGFYYILCMYTRMCAVWIGESMRLILNERAIFIFFLQFFLLILGIFLMKPDWMFNKYAFC